MSLSIRRTALLAAAIAVLCAAEVAAFGQDRPGLAHDISVAAFLGMVVAAAALLGCGLLALLRRNGRPER